MLSSHALLAVVALLLALALAAPAVAQPAATTARPAATGEALAADLRATIHAAVSQVLAQAGAPSASIAVVKDGQIAYVRAYGSADGEAKRLATPAMRYSIGSISKQFTAAALLLLAEEGKLSLDDRVARFVPDLTRAGDVTLRQILSMTSGYQDYGPQDYVMPDMLRPVAAREILPR